MTRGQGPSPVVAALVLLFAHRDFSQSALACFHYETAYVGDDLLNSNAGEVETVEKCQEACQKNTDCSHWTYDSKHRHCHLKGNDAQSYVVRDPLAVSGPRYCTLPSQCVTHGFEFNSASDVDRIEDGSVPSAEACQSICAQHPECSFWTYYSSSKKCHLKGPEAESMQPVYKAAAISGPKYCPRHITLTCFQTNMDYIWEPNGQETKHHQNVSSARECQKICQLDSACNYFTYIETTKLCASSKTMRYPIYRLGATTGPKFCSPPASTGENVELFGKNVATHKTRSYKVCQQLCETNPLCTAATYSAKSTKCVLKQTARFAEEIVSGPKVCRWLGRIPHTERETSQGLGLTAAAGLADNPSEIGVDAAPSAAMPAHTERSPFATDGESLCTLHGIRRHYTYKQQEDVYFLHEVSGKWLQSGSARRVTTEDHHGSQGCFHRGVEVLGRDVGAAVAEGPAACQRICRENELCSFFAYNTSSMLCMQRQQAVWAPGLMSFEKLETRRYADTVKSPSEENTDFLSAPATGNNCFSSGYHYEEAVVILEKETKSAEACKILCQKEPSCMYFTYSKKERLCGLLQSRGRKVPKEDSVCGPKFCGVETPNAVAGGSLTPCFLIGYFYDGPSLTHVGGVVSTEDCQRYCQKKTRCRSFTYFRNKQLCNLLLTEGDLVEEPDAVAGPRACPALSNRMEDGDASRHWSWGDARSSTPQDDVASAETCQALCAQKPFCDVFTYYARDQRCLLHSGHRIVKPEEGWTAGSRPRHNAGVHFRGAMHGEWPVYAYRRGLRSAQECQRLCETNPSCKSFTFHEKGVVRIRVRQQGAEKVEEDAVAERQTTARQNERHSESCLLQGLCSPEDVPTVAFKDHVTSAQACQGLCEENPLCSVFTYASVQQTCKMHPKETDRQNETVLALATLSGFLTHTVEDDCFSHGFYYDGPAVAIGRKVKGAKECQRLCQEEPRCKYFSYFIAEELCGLLPEEGHKVPESDAICGPRICPLGLWEAR